MQSTIWREFPEINRKIAFSSTYTSNEAVSVGCHCGSISSVSITFGSSYYAANRGNNLQIIDASKGPAVKKARGDYGNMVPSRDEYQLVGEYLKKIDFKFETVAEETYDHIIGMCNKYPLWVLSDVVNKDAPIRKQKTYNLGVNLFYESFGSTLGFVKYLMANKKGYVLASPIIQNPNHKTKSNYSLNQAWFWIPPEHLSHTLNVAEAHGEDLLPTDIQWAAQVADDV